MKCLLMLCILYGALSLQSCTGCGADEDLPLHRTSTTGAASDTMPKTGGNQQPPPMIVHGEDKPTVVHMKKQDGVWIIPVTINGTEMDFIFDTGAGLITISDAEASLLYKQGKITDSDILGAGQFTDANGDINEGTIINLKEVRIGGRIIENIQASVLNNSKGPLLFGQSALEKFGRVNIDYVARTITFY